MEQPPILGRPRWPGSPQEPPAEQPQSPGPQQPQTPPTAPAHDPSQASASPPAAGRPSTDPPAADLPATGSPAAGSPAAWPPEPPTSPPPADWQAPEPTPPGQRRSMRQMVLGTAGVALIALIACNGGLLWLYQHSSLGVVITLGTFIAAGAAAWLALKAGVFTGIFAAGITLVGLVLLSLIGLLYYTGERGRTSTIVSSGTAIAVIVSMIGAYGFLTWDYHETTYRAPYVEPPQDAVYWLIEGQAATRLTREPRGQRAGNSGRYTDRRRHRDDQRDRRLRREGDQGPRDVDVPSRKGHRRRILARLPHRPPWLIDSSPAPQQLSTGMNSWCPQRWSRR